MKTPLDLSGRWSFQIDSHDVGLDEQWYNQSLEHEISLPGSLQAQGFGDEVTVGTGWTGSIVDRSWFDEPRYAPYREPGNVKVPFWLQPDKHYMGAAWYSREIEMPADWRGQRATLTLERPHWATQVWLDGRTLGSDTSLSTPHVYELGSDIAPGSHRLTIRVDNRMIVEVGPNAHSVSDHTQSNWNGIVGALTLTAGSPIYITSAQVFPNISTKSATVKITLVNTLGHAGKGVLALQASLKDGSSSIDPISQEVEIAADETTVEVVYPLGDDVRLWDEFDPAVYRLDLALNMTIDGENYTDNFTTSFGLREIGVQGTQLAINGRAIFLRGTLECSVFPLTGAPPTDLDSWRRIVRICQDHGLNHIRFHSWCPPEAAFVAADELGCYFQVECASWANQGSGLGEGRSLDRWLYDEAERIIAAYGNHPSFVMLAYGNEPGGNFKEYLTDWVTYWREHDPRRVHTSGAGWPALPENDYHNIPQPRIQAWGKGLQSRINGKPPETRTDYSDYVEQYAAPIVSHEIGQWCVYPNFDEMAKYTGVLKPKNFEIFRDQLAANSMIDQAHAFLIASGKLQALCYKEEIESALRTPGFGGFQLLSLNDFPGQGTALVGILDPFWDEKGYISAAAFRRFCNSTVPLARLDRRYWRTGEHLIADIDIAHFGPAALTNATVIWRLVDSAGATVANGALPATDVPTGGVTQAGTISAPLEQFASAQKYTLVVGIAGTPFENDWDIWLFADQLETAVPEDVLVTSELDTAALRRLATGGNVLLLAPADQVRAPSIMGFSSVFWNTAWTRGFSNDAWPNGQPPHTLGIVCDPAHPALADFPTEDHSNWQWWELIHGAAALHLDGLPHDLRPIVQPIDTWFEARRLGLLVEAQVNGGKLLISSMDLQSDLDQRMVARQMRNSLLHYMASDSFDPMHQISVEAVKSLFLDEAGSVVQ